MKFLRALILSIVLFAQCLTFTAKADLLIWNNCTICFFGDSWNAGGIGDDGAIAGYRFECYIHSYFVLNYPTKNISFYNWSRGGADMNEMITNRVQQDGLPSFAYQYNTNQHIGLACMTDNGGTPTSNIIYQAMALVFQAPTNMSDGDFPLTAQTGWSSSNTIQWVAVGEPPEQSSDGDFRQRDRNNGATNAGWMLGLLGVDAWNFLAPFWTSDFNANGGTNVQWLPRGGHFASGGALSWAFAFLRGITTDTNISTCIVDFNSTSPVATNHCVISSISKSGTTLTFSRLDDRLPFGWDVPDGTITNDARGAFNLNPADADFFRFSLQINNLPAGNYNVLIDGVLCSTLSDAQLGAGWNMVTNVAGPYWAQRKEVLGRTRDLESLDRVTLIQRSAGTGAGLAAVGSAYHDNWGLGNRGDALIEAGNAITSRVQTNFTAIHAAVQPTNHTFQIIPINTMTITNAVTSHFIFGSLGIKTHP